VRRFRAIIGAAPLKLELWHSAIDGFLGFRAIIGAAPLKQSVIREIIPH